MPETTQHRCFILTIYQLSRISLQKQISNRYNSEVTTKTKILLHDHHQVSNEIIKKLNPTNIVSGLFCLLREYNSNNNNSI